jgi:MFS family permease
MITMPLAGVFADKIGPGKIVMGGITLIAISLVMWVPLGADTPYWYLLLGLFIQGLGMGATMMPTFSAGLAALREHTIARGSTLMNIIQQVAASVGTAVFTVLLTNNVKNLHPSSPADALDATAGAFGNVFLVAAILTVLCLIPAAFLPRTKSETTHDQPIVLH